MTKKTIAMTCAICICIATGAHAQIFSQQPQAPCKCPTGYSQLWIGGSIMCVAAAIDANPCPTGARYDQDQEDCTADPDQQGQCPPGLRKSLYKDTCVGQPRQNATATPCPPNGYYDESLNLCTAQCGAQGNTGNTYGR